MSATPVQPTGALLDADARAREIAALQTLRDQLNSGKPAPPAPDSAETIQKQAASQGDAALKQIQKCSQPGADSDPTCQAATGQ